MISMANVSLVFSLQEIIKRAIKEMSTSAIKNLAMQPKDEPIEKIKAKDVTMGETSSLVIVQSYK